MKGHKIVKNMNGSKELDIATCVFDSEVIRNNIEARCSVIRGELPYNVLLGITLKAGKDELDLTIMNIINNTYGVKEIDKFSSSIVNRKYTANVNIITQMNNEITVEVQ